jgi:hypothetical protein
MGNHNREGLVRRLLDHYPRGHGMMIHCACGRRFCCSVSFVNHQVEEVQSFMSAFANGR